MTSGPVRSDELGCAIEQRGSGPVVQAVAGAPTGDGESQRGAFGQLVVRLSELRVIAGGLLEVVADDLVALDESVAVLVEPVCEARVQVGADSLGEGVVGSVADQQVAEAVAVVAGDLSAVGTEELAPHECCEPGRDLSLLGRKRLHTAAVEDLALDRAALEDATLGLVELVEAGGEQRLQRRRHLDFRVLGRHRQHLGDEERVAGRSVCDPRRATRPRPRRRSARLRASGGSGSRRSDGAGQDGR